MDFRLKISDLRFENLTRSTANPEVLRNFGHAVKTSESKETGAKEMRRVTHNSVFAAAHRCRRARNRSPAFFLTQSLTRREIEIEDLRSQISDLGLPGAGDFAQPSAFNNQPSDVTAFDLAAKPVHIWLTILGLLRIVEHSDLIPMVPPAHHPKWKVRASASVLLSIHHVVISEKGRVPPVDADAWIKFESGDIPIH